MGLFEKLGTPLGNKIAEKLAKQKEEMAKRMQHFKKNNPDVSDSGQRHSFDYKVRH